MKLPLPSIRSGRLAAVLLAVGFLAACSDGGPLPMAPDHDAYSAADAGTPESGDATVQLVEDLPVELCKSWIGDDNPSLDFEFEYSVTLGGELIDGPANATRNSGSGACPELGTWPADAELTITEIEPEGIELVTIALIGRDGSNSLLDDPEVPSVTIRVGDYSRVYFKNQWAPGGGEGCTPGFWRQPQHYQFWTDLEPGDLWSDVFDVPEGEGSSTAGPGKSNGRGNARSTSGPLTDETTLGEAVQLQGGGVNALARHAVAAILNASNPDIDYDLTVAEIIDLVNDAIASGEYNDAKDILEGFNEQGCDVK